MPRLTWSPGIRARLVGIVCIFAAGLGAAGLAAHRANDRIIDISDEIVARQALMPVIVDLNGAVEAAQLRTRAFIAGKDQQDILASEEKVKAAGKLLTRMAGDDALKEQTLRLKDALSRIEGSLADVIPRELRSGGQGLGDLRDGLDLASQELSKVADRLAEGADRARAGIVALLSRALRVEWASRLAPDRMQELEIGYVLEDARTALTSLAGIDPSIPKAIDAYEAAFQAWLTPAASISNNAAVARDVFGILAPLIRELRDQVTKSSVALLDRRQQELSRLSAQLWIALGLVAMLAFLLAWVVGRSISRPIEQIRTAMAKISAGEMSAVIPHQDNRHEIGSMARSVAVFREAMMEREALNGDQLREAAARGARSERLTGLAEGFNAAIASAEEQLSSVSSDMDAVSAKLADLSGHLDSQMRHAREAVEGTARRTAIVASAADELSTSIAHINSQIHETTSSVADAAKSGRAAEGRMDELQGVAGEISAVATLIGDIAGRTNLLALNATIEAARAGEAGRGFSVVAAEVKELAQKTASATSDIAARIAAIQASAGEGGRSVQDLAVRLRTIEAATSSVASAVSQQDGSVAEIARVAADLSNDASRTSDASAEASDVARETVAAAEELTSLSRRLAEARSRFTVETARFVAEVRAA